MSFVILSFYLLLYIKMTHEVEISQQAIYANLVKLIVQIKYEQNIRCSVFIVFYNIDYITTFL